MKSRPLYQIAADIRKDWKNPYFGAVPYLEALEALESINDMYGLDNARSMVAYFLANAQTWKGETARNIKKELNALIKR